MTWGAADWVGWICRLGIAHVMLDAGLVLRRAYAAVLIGQPPGPDAACRVTGVDRPVDASELPSPRITTFMLPLVAELYRPRVCRLSALPHSGLPSVLANPD